MTAPKHKASITLVGTATQAGRAPAENAKLAPAADLSPTTAIVPSRDGAIAGTDLPTTPANTAAAPPARRRLRSRRVALALAGATMMTLAACEDKKVDAEAFPDLESCLAAAQKDSLFFTAADCRTAFSDAKKNWEETAPRYESKALCEQQHGVGNCGGDPAASQPQGSADPAAAQQQGSGFSFMPLFMGYMLGSMLGRGGGIFSQPMIRNGAGGFTTPNGNQSFATNRGTGKVAPATFNRAPATVGKPPMSAAQVSQRGGFGSSATRGTGGAARSSGG